MRAFVEHVASVIRVGKDDGEYGKPYHFAATVRWFNPQEIEIVGLAKPEGVTSPAITKADWRAILVELGRLGVKRVMITRLKQGFTVQKWFNVSTRRREK